MFRQALLPFLLTVSLTILRALGTKGMVDVVPTGTQAMSQCET